MTLVEIPAGIVSVERSAVEWRLPAS